MLYVKVSVRLAIARQDLPLPYQAQNTIMDVITIVFNWRYTVNKAITIGLIGLMLFLGIQAAKETPAGELADYVSFTGTIAELRDDSILVHEAGNEENAMIFGMTKDTLLLDERSRDSLDADGFEIGQEITAYYREDAPMALSYPALMNPDVLIRRSSEDRGFVHVAAFDDTLTSSDGKLKIVLGAGMELCDRNGKPVTSLAGKNLVVFYADSTRSIPAQTTPEKIIVF